ncbi:MAG: DUF4838 domain-containing protein [Planctomycetes bacterium]|nr:DUF4838 domain-containing protein [Planctomycetota bacterium]
MSLRLSQLLMGACLIPCFATAAAASLTLVTAGASDYVIVRSGDASASEQWAVTELVDHLKQMTGVELPVRDAAAPLPAKAIVIGGSPAAALGVTIDADGLGDDGFIIRTVGDRLVIAGGPRRGTLYGVYTFLESLGVRWWAPNETTVPTRPTVTVGDLDIRQVPVLEYRDFMYGEMFSPEGRLWAARNKINGMAWADAPEQLGGRYEFVGNLVHSYMGLLGDSGVQITPDMLALVDGKRQNTQPCLTNPKVLEAIVKAVIAKFRQNPDARFVVVGQNDNHGYCRCDACQAIAAREESQAGPVIVFANQVAERVEQVIPGARICTAAYEWSRKPPAHVKPRPNVHITLCTIECDFSRPFAEGASEVNEAFRDDIIGWSRIVDKMFIWDYTTNFHHFLAPHPNLDVLTANVKFFADHGAAGVFEQGSHTCRSAEFSRLRMWVLARSLWNPQADGAALIEEFLAGYYGPAAPALREYIDAIHGPVRREAQVVRCFMPLNSPYLAPETIARAEAACRKAEAAVAGSEPYASRVALARLPIQYVLLKAGPGSRTWKTTETAVGPMSFPAMAEAFTATVRRWDVNQAAERHGIEGFLGWLADYSRHLSNGSAPVPPELADLPPAAYTLIQACQGERGAQWYVSAEGASDGWAVRCDTTGWLIRYHFGADSGLDPQRTYRLFVRVRGDVADGASGDAWSCGVRGDGNRHVTLRVAADQMPDAQWRAFEVGRFRPADAQYFWIALQDTKVLNRIDLDCLWLVAAE